MADPTIDNLRRRKSGASADNLGGAMHADEVSNNVTNNIWRKITETEAQSGITIFRGFYIYNNHTTGAIKNVILYFGTPVTNTGLEISLAQGTSAISSTSVEPAIATETTTPAILGNNWIANPTSRTEGLAISGDINPGAHAFVWMRMVVPSGTQSSVFTHYRMKVEAFNPAAAGNIPEDWGMIFAANMECTPDNVQAFSNMSKRDFQFFQTCGNNIVSSSNTACFITNLNNEGLRPKTKICLGYADETTVTGTSNPTKKNALMTEFTMTTEYYSYDVYNVHFTVMKYESSYNLGNAHYNWVKQDLETARQRPGITWLIVVVNDNMYAPTNLGNFDPQPNPSQPSTSLRDVYHPLFMANSVHLVISGGTNMWYQTRAIKYNPAAPDSPIIVQVDQATSSASMDYTWFDKGLEGGASVFVSVGTIGLTPVGTSNTDLPTSPGAYVAIWGGVEPKKSYNVIQFSNFGTKMNILRYKHTIDELTQKSSITKVLPP
jgi:hypothetical protein